MSGRDLTGIGSETGHRTLYEASDDIKDKWTHERVRVSTKSPSEPVRTACSSDCFSPTLQLALDKLRCLQKPFEQVRNQIRLDPFLATSHALDHIRHVS